MAQVNITLSLALGAVLLLAYNSPYLNKIATKIFCNFQVEILLVDAIKHVAKSVYLRSTLQPHRYFPNPYFQDEYFIEVSELYNGAGGTCDYRDCNQENAPSRWSRTVLSVMLSTER